MCYISTHATLHGQTLNTIVICVQIISKCVINTYLIGSNTSKCMHVFALFLFHRHHRISCFIPFHHQWQMFVKRSLAANNGWNVIYYCGASEFVDFSREFLMEIPHRPCISSSVAVQSLSETSQWGLKSYQICLIVKYSLEWRHNEHGGVSNHQPHDCLLNRQLWHRSKKISKLRVTDLCAGNSPVTG